MQLDQIGPNNLIVSWTNLDPIGANWTILDQIVPNWTKLDQIGSNWTKSCQIGQNQMNLAKDLQTPDHNPSDFIQAQAKIK